MRNAALRKSDAWSVTDRYAKVTDVCVTVVYTHARAIAQPRARSRPVPLTDKRNSHVRSTTTPRARLLTGAWERIMNACG